MLVASVMSHPVVTIDPRSTTVDAAAQMRERRFRHLLVVEDGRIVGIVSDRDVGEPTRPIGEVMHRRVITVTADTPVESAAVLMLENKIGALPVVGAAGEPVGMVTESDLFRLLTQMLGGQEPSTRLALRVRNLPQDLTLVAALACTLGVPITSLLTEPTPEGAASGGRSVVVRLGTIDAARFVSALRNVGIGVDAPERGGWGG